LSELVIIGGGPAGVTAALRARELGAEVILIERKKLGGTCTNDGCVPTRALAKAARLVRDAEQFADYGLRGLAPRVDFSRVLLSARRVVEEVHDEKRLRDRLEAAGVEVFDGAGDVHFADPHTVRLENGGPGGTEVEIQGDHFIICAGGHARRLGFPGSEHALTHSDVWDMESLPESVAIIGAAATGCQLASIFAAFGCRVRLLELAPRILPGEDEDVSRVVGESFERRGIQIETGIGGVNGIERVSDGSEGLLLSYDTPDGERKAGVDTVMLSVGWPGNVDALGLEAAGVATDKGHIVVDDTLQTSVPHIFAAGDITGRVMLVQSATYEGSLAAEHAVLGAENAQSHEIVPHGGFTDPEYASVGLTEEAARAEHDCVVSSVPYADLDRGVIDGHQEGFCKLIVDRASRRILGAHIVGEQAVEVVQLVATAMRGEMPVEELADVEFAYPTFTAIVGLVARRAARGLGVTIGYRGWSLQSQLGVAEWELGKDHDETADVRASLNFSKA
jgi:pyruvate/2-oxoglutarate dehydrogenase complex dihydrolipoamide dehydrogenase (E3) component